MCVSRQCIRPPAGGHGLLSPALGRFSENQPQEQAAGGDTHDSPHVTGTGRENAALTSTERQTRTLLTSAVESQRNM
jgi:hypothetical protein